MKLVVGLGNPGSKYLKTRHNVGFMAADALVQNLQINDFRPEQKFRSLLAKDGFLIIAKPQTFMNDSGLAVKNLCDFYKVEESELYIIHDDLDIKIGAYKVQKSRGPKLHYGVNSVEKMLGGESFWRVRIGVENRKAEDQISGEEYVLQNFESQEAKIIEEVIKKVIEDLSLRLK